MRATAQNLVAAQLMGISVERVIAATFFVGGYLAGLAAWFTRSRSGGSNIRWAFRTGFMRSRRRSSAASATFPGAVLGGMLLGLIYSFGGGYSQGKWIDALIFGVLIVLLIFRPTGMLGSRSREKV